MLASRARAGSARPVVLIDGRSGSGKTTLGRALAPLLDAQLVELDDVYPGWHGLARASEAVVRDMLRAAEPGHRRWDWDAGEPSTWRSLDPRRPLVIEGAGALTRASAPLATLRVWVELDDESRRSRVRERSVVDAADYADSAWWDVWAAQEGAHRMANDPRRLADVVVEG
ncbi:ATP-binding protein [Frondihabitans sp. VKM Ac-2883]|nr:ATP-binding protein [Frondihabitans sp. VKM Ac-2883]